MTTRNYSANANATTLSAGINNSTTTVPVVATTGFPAAPFLLALDYNTATQEIVLVTAVAGLNLTVTRGYDSTTAQAHTLGAAVKHVHSAIDFRDSRTHEAATTGVHGTTGAVVGTTQAQALTNKDLTTGNTFPTSLLTASGAATVTNKDLTSGTNTFPSSLATDAEVTTAVNNHAALTSTHGVAGALVGTTDAQTLTNKTLTSPTINTPTIASPTFSGDFVGGVRYIEKTVDEPLASSTVFQDDDALVFTVAANAIYEFTIKAQFTGTANTSGIKWQLVGPAGTTGSALTSVTLTATPFDATDKPPSSGGSDPFSGGNPYEGMNGNYRVKTSATSGSVKLQWAQSVSNAASVVGKAGGFIIARRVG